MNFYNEYLDFFPFTGRDQKIEQEQFTLLIKEKCSLYNIGSPELIKIKDYDIFIKSYKTIKGHDAFDCLKSWIPSKNPGINGSILRFLIALIGYDKKLIIYPKLEDLILNASDPEYSTILKRIRMKSFLKSTDSILEVESEEYKNSPYHYINRDIGEVFNYQWLPWLEVEINDFYEVSFTPCEGDEKYFRKLTRNWFKQQKEGFEINIEKIKRSILINIKSSSSQLGPNWYERQFKDRNVFSTCRQPVVRKIIHVSPGNSRDTVINRLEDLNTINLIEIVLFKYLSFIDANVCDNEEKFKKSYSDFAKNYNYFWCRDFEKEGLTRPRYINRVILEEFKKFTGIDLPVSFFDNYRVIDNNKIISPPRGTGLGMANSLVTILQLILHSATVDETSAEMGQEEDEYFENELFCLNDDNIVGFQNLEDLEYFKLIEDRIFTRLGLIKKKSKSFHSFKSGVFCERYFSILYNNINRKESFEERVKYDPYRIKNPLLRYERYKIPDICSVQEKLPVQLGGCLESEFGSFFLVHDEEFTEKELIQTYCLINMNKKYFLPKSCFHERVRRDFNKPYENPIEQIFPGFKDIIKESELGFFNYIKIKELAQRFNTLKFNSEKEQIYFDNFYRKKLSDFNQLYRNFDKYQNTFDWKEIEKLLIKSNKFILPNRGQILDPTDLEWFELNSNGKLFINEDPFEELISFRMGLGGNPFGFSFKKKDSQEGLFPFPKDPSLYKKYFQTYGDPINARKQFNETLCLPLLEEDYCSEKFIEISNLGISRNFIKFVNNYGPVIDYKIIELINSLTEEQFNIFIELIDSSFRIEKYEEDIEITQEDLEYISYFKSQIFKKDFYKMPEILEEENVSQLKIEEDSFEKYSGDIINILYQQYYNAFNLESFDYNIEEYEDFKQKTNAMLKQALEKCYNIGIKYSSEDGYIILPHSEIEVDEINLTSYVDHYLTFDELPFMKSNNLKRFIAIARTYKTLMKNIISTQLARENIQIFYKLEPIVNGFEVTDFIEEINLLRDFFIQQEQLKEDDDIMVFPDDW